MRDSDKRLLRTIMKNEPETTNQEAADDCNCSVATARKYRRIFAPKGQTSDQ